jgi:hypothetical protein
MFVVFDLDLIMQLVGQVHPGASWYTLAHQDPTRRGLFAGSLSRSVHAGMLDEGRVLQSWGGCCRVTKKHALVGKGDSQNRQQARISTARADLPPIIYTTQTHASML